VQLAHQNNHEQQAGRKQQELLLEKQQLNHIPKATEVKEHGKYVGALPSLVNRSDFRIYC